MKIAQFIYEPKKANEEEVNEMAYMTFQRAHIFLVERPVSLRFCLQRPEPLRYIHKDLFDRKKMYDPAFLIDLLTIVYFIFRDRGWPTSTHGRLPLLIHCAFLY